MRGGPVRGKTPGGGHLIPINAHLWKLVERQARIKFHPFPSPAASTWMHTKYKEMGGRFRDSKNQAEKKIAEKEERMKSPSQKREEKKMEEFGKRSTEHEKKGRK